MKPESELTPAARAQRRFNERTPEVRGIYAPKEDHEEIKLAATMTKKLLNSIRQLENE